MRAFQSSRKVRLRFLRSRVAYCNDLVNAWRPRRTLTRLGWLKPLVALRILLCLAREVTPRLTLIGYTPKFFLMCLAWAPVRVFRPRRARLRLPLFLLKKWFR